MDPKFPARSPNFLDSQAHTPWTSTNKKKPPTVPPIRVLPSFEQSRREIRRPAGTCNAITDEHSHDTPGPVDQPVNDTPPVRNQASQSK